MMSDENHDVLGMDTSTTMRLKADDTVRPFVLSHPRTRPLEHVPQTKKIHKRHDDAIICKNTFYQ